MVSNPRHEIVLDFPFIAFYYSLLILDLILEQQNNNFANRYIVLYCIFLLSLLNNMTEIRCSLVILYCKKLNFKWKFLKKYNLSHFASKNCKKFLKFLKNWEFFKNWAKIFMKLSKFSETEDQKRRNSTLQNFYLIYLV